MPLVYHAEMLVLNFADANLTPKNIVHPIPESSVCFWSCLHVEVKQLFLLPFS